MDGEEDKGGNRVLKRLRRLERERRQKRKERNERMQKRLAQVVMLDDSTTPAAATQRDSQQDNMVPTPPDLQQPHHIDTIMRDLPQPQQHCDDSAMQQDDTLQDNVDADTVVIPGEAISTDLWLQIDRPTRSVLRRVHDFAFLHAVEQLLMQFKHHCHAIMQDAVSASASSSPPPPFTPVSLPSSSYFHVVPSPIPQEVGLLMPQPFQRLLTYALLAFHFMYAATTGGQRGRRRGRGGEEEEEASGLLVVRMQRGYVYHQCELEHYIRSHFSSAV